MNVSDRDPAYPAVFLLKNTHSINRQQVFALGLEAMHPSSQSVCVTHIT